MKISNMFKKIGSAAFLALSLAATTVWGGVATTSNTGSYEFKDLPSAIKAVSDGGTVTVIGPVSTEMIPLEEGGNKSFTLDLNGQTVNCSGFGFDIMVPNLHITLKDSKGTGLLRTVGLPVVFEGENDWFTLDGAKIAFGTSIYTIGFASFGAVNPKVEIKSGEISVLEYADNVTVKHNGWLIDFGNDEVGPFGNGSCTGGNVIISGGKINELVNHKDFDGLINLAGNSSPSAVSVKISGGEINTDKGTFISGGTGATIKITGGTFKGAVVSGVNSILAKDGKELDAEGHVVAKQGGGQEQGGDEPGGDVPGGDEPGGDEPGGDDPVVPAGAVAMIGETPYTDIAAAYNAVQNGQTIKLVADCRPQNGDWRLKRTQDASVVFTLDLNGKTLQFGDIYVCGGMRLTICDSKAPAGLLESGFSGICLYGNEPTVIFKSGRYQYKGDQGYPCAPFMGMPSYWGQATSIGYHNKAFNPMVEIDGGEITLSDSTFTALGFVDFGNEPSSLMMSGQAITSGGTLVIKGGTINSKSKPLVNTTGNTSPVTVSVTGGTFTGDETFLASVKAAAGEGNYVEETGKVMVKKVGPEGAETQQPVIVDATAELTAKYGEGLAKKVMDAAQTFAATAGESGLENAPIAQGGKLVADIWTALQTAAGDDAAFFDNEANNSVSGLKTKTFVQIKPVGLAINERGKVINGDVINMTSFEVRPMVSVEVNGKVIVTQIPNNLLPEGGVTFRLGLSNDFRSYSGNVIVTHWKDNGDEKISETKIKKGGEFGSFFVETSATTFAPRFDVANYDTAEDEGYDQKVDMRPDNDPVFANAPSVVVNLTTGIEYPTLQRAFDNVTNGQILKLLDNVAGSTWNPLQANDNILARKLHQDEELAFILDLNGKNITWNGLAAFCIGSNVHMTLTDMSELDEDGKRHGSVTADSLVVLQGENPWFTLEEGKIVYGTGAYAFCFWAFDQFGGSSPIYVGRRTPKNPKVDVLGGEILMNEYMDSLTVKYSNYVFMFGAYCKDDNLASQYAQILSFGGTCDGGTVVIKGGFFHGLSTDVSKNYDGLVYFKGNIGKPTLDVSGCEMEIWTDEEEKKGGLFVTKTENPADTEVRVVGGTFRGSDEFKEAVKASLTERCKKMEEKVVKDKDGDLFIDPLPNGPEVETDTNALVVVRTSAGTIRTDETSERVSAKIREVTDVINTATVQTGVKETLVYQADGKMTSGARDAFLGEGSALTPEQKTAIDNADKSENGCNIDMYLHIDPVEVRVDDVEQDVDGDMLPTKIVRGVVFNVKPYLCTSVGTERVSVEIPNTMLPMQGLTFRLGMPPDFQQTPEVKVIHWSGRKGEEGSVILDNRPYPIFVDDDGFKYVEMTFYHFCDFELNNSFIYPSDPVYENTGKAVGDVDFIDARPGARLVAVPCSPTVGYNGSNPDHPLFRFATSTNDWGSAQGGQPVEIDVSVNGGAATKLCDVTADEGYDWGTSQNGVYTFSYKCAGEEKQKAVFYATDLITQIGSNGTVVAVLDGEGNVTRLDVTLTTNIVQQLVVNETVPVKFNIGEYSIVGPDGTDYTAENRDGRSAILVAEGVPENVTIEIVGTGSIGGGDAYEGSGAAKGGLAVGWGSNLGVPPEGRVVYGEFVTRPESLDGLQYTLDAVRQRYPWNGKVDVVYTLSNRGLDSAGGYEAMIVFTGADATYTAKLEGATFEKGQNHGLCDVSTFMPKGLDKQAFRCKLYIKRRAQ